MIIYLRHANDSQKRSRYKHDNHINKKGKLEAKEMTHKLIDKYGYPTKIYYSPFLRCRETLTVMVNELLYKKKGQKIHFCLKCGKADIKNIDINLDLVCDPDLSRYFVKDDRKKPSVSSSTLKFEVPIYEKKEGLIKRLDNHVESIKKEDKGVIWCITHAIIYKKIAQRLDIVTPESIDFLDHYVYVC